MLILCRPREVAHVHVDPLQPKYQSTRRELADSEDDGYDKETDMM